MQAALRHGLVPVICVGETSEDLEKFGPALCRSGSCRSPSKVSRRRRTSSWPTNRSGRSAPGQAATPEQAQEVCAKLREVVAEKLGQDAAERTRVLYGGSVKSANIASFMREPDVDGALVGGASLVVESSRAIIRFRKHVGV